MASFTFIVTKAAQADIATLDVVTKKRLQKKLVYFVASGQPLSFAIQLVNVYPPLYRFRIGKYRVFFDIHDNELRILAIDKRDQAYKNIK